MIRISLWLVVLFLSSFTFCQRYSFVGYSTSNGLPQSQVSSITQDSLGYLWIGTFGGLAKFNGINFVNYSKRDGLLSNRVTCLTFIRNELYIGHDNGISVFDGLNNFTNLLFPEKTPPSNVTSIIQRNNEIFISTNGQGLFKLQNNQLILIEHSPSRIRAAVDTGNEMILATRNGVIIFSDDNIFHAISGFPDESYSGIDLIEDEIVVTSYDGNVYSYNLEHQQITKVYANDKYLWRSVLADSESIWLNSSDGAVKLENNKQVVLDRSTGLPIDDITIVFRDREGNIWLGTGGKGLQKFSGETFVHYNLKSGLPSELIISTIETNDGSLWLSSYDQGVFQFNPVNNEIINMVTPINQVVWTTTAQNNDIYFGSIFGLYLKTNQGWRFIDESDGLPSNKITGLYAHDNGRVYVGTGNGLAILENGLVTSVVQSDDANLMNIRGFTWIEDRLLMAAQNGIYELSEDGSKAVKKHSFDGALNCIVTDRNNHVWVGTENGLYKMFESGFDFIFLGERKGSEYINFIKEGLDAVYIGTNNGLFEYDFETNRFTHFGINAGLVDLETNLNSAFLDKNENLWFGTVGGLMKMNSEQRMSVRDQDVKPKIHLKTLSVNFKEKPVAKLSNAYQSPLNFKHFENNFSITFDAIYLTNPKAITFSYYLEGLSEEWSPKTTNKSLNFTNLPPNEYRLQVRAFLPYSETFITEQGYYFSIESPFYQTWWFYLIVVVFCFGILYAADRYRTLRKDRLNYQERLEFQSKLLQLEQQSLNASMNRHFIFNALNSIQYFINASDKLSANKYLTRFAQLIRKNLDSSNHYNGMVPLSDELDRLKLYLDLEMMRFKNKFDFELVVDKKVEVEELIVPAMFLQPFVENSIIHGVLPLKDRRGKITITITNYLNHILIEIFDNGVGFEKSMRKKEDVQQDHESQGVLITRGRIELLQKISAKSIELIGPHQINENDNSVKGTMVKFKILKQYLDK